MTASMHTEIRIHKNLKRFQLDSHASASVASTQLVRARNTTSWQRAWLGEASLGKWGHTGRSLLVQVGFSFVDD